MICIYVLNMVMRNNVSTAIAICKHAIRERRKGTYTSWKNGSMVKLGVLIQRGYEIKIYKHMDSQAHIRSMEIAQVNYRW